MPVIFASGNFFFKQYYSLVSHCKLETQTPPETTFWFFFSQTVIKKLALHMAVPFYLQMQASVKKVCCSRHHNQGSVKEILIVRTSKIMYFMKTFNQLQTKLKPCKLSTCKIYGYDKYYMPSETADPLNRSQLFLS